MTIYQAMEQTSPDDFAKKAFTSCIKAALVGSLCLLTFLIINTYITTTTHLDYLFIKRLMMVYVMVLPGCLFYVLVLGFPTLLILNQYQLNHPIIASLSGAMIVAIILMSMFNDFFFRDAPGIGALLCMTGAIHGFVASYFSRKQNHTKHLHHANTRNDS